MHRYPSAPVAPPDIDDRLHLQDAGHIRALVARAGVFSPQEIAIAGELVEAALSGRDPGYCFLFCRDTASGVPLAYTCYGEIPLTDRRYDLYWIAVDPAWRGHGMAQRLLAETERRILAVTGGAAWLYAETSGTQPYAPARAFYLRHGFEEAARLTDFYRDGDDKIIFRKMTPPTLRK